MIDHFIDFNVVKFKLIFCAGKGTWDDDGTAESESASSTAKKSKSGSPDDVEIIGAIARETREGSRR